MDTLPRARLYWRDALGVQHSICDEKFDEFDKQAPLFASATCCECSGHCKKDYPLPKDFMEKKDIGRSFSGMVTPADIPVAVSRLYDSAGNELPMPDAMGSGDQL